MSNRYEWTKEFREELNKLNKADVDYVQVDLLKKLDKIQEPVRIIAAKKNHDLMRKIDEQTTENQRITNCFGKYKSETGFYCL